MSYIKENSSKDIHSNDNDFYLDNAERGTTLWYQVAVIVRLRRIAGVNSILEVGAGRGTTGAALRHIGFNYNILEKLPSQRDRKLITLQSSTEESVSDIVCAFQMLEHNSLASFGKLLKRMRDLSKRYVVISLPVASPYLRLEIEPKFWSGYSVASRGRLSATIFLPRKAFPRPRGFVHRWALNTVLTPSTDSAGAEVEASRGHLWEVGESGAKPRQLLRIAESEGLTFIRKSLPPYSSKQIFFEFEI